MIEYKAVYNDDYISHYGVLGMKWGVRRYENKGGNYTKRGLKYFKGTEKKYNQAKEHYKLTKKQYKQHKVSKSALKAAKANKRTAKDKLNKNYKQLKNDYMADKGQKLYSRGKTIDGSMFKTSTFRNRASGIVGATGAIGVGLNAGRAPLLNYLIDSGNLKAFAAASKAIPIANKLLLPVAGAAFAGNAVLTAINSRREKQLRAYYGHSAKYEK